MTLPIQRTARGFAVARFVDRNGVECSVQDSSLAREPALWLGTDHVTPQVLVPGEGWRAVPIPADAVVAARMHLTRAQVAALLPLLTRFLETGSIAE